MIALVCLGILVDVVLTRLMVGTGRAQEVGPVCKRLLPHWSLFYAFQAVRMAVAVMGIALIPVAWFAAACAVVVWAPTVVGLGSVAWGKATT